MSPAIRDEEIPQMRFALRAARRDDFTTMISRLRCVRCADGHYAAVA
jgi:hypothetical protein